MQVLMLIFLVLDPPLELVPSRRVGLLVHIDCSFSEVGQL